MTDPGVAGGPIAILINGVPRSGKTSLAWEVITNSRGGWVQIGVDSMMQDTPESLLPGLGLRPGAERPDLEPVVQASYQQLFNNMKHHLSRGVNVAADVGIHDDYSEPMDILGELQWRLAGFRTLFVGLHCSLEVLRERRQATGYPSWAVGEPVPTPVLRWQQAVHADMVYDLELDSSAMSIADCAAAIHDHLRAIGHPID